MAPQGRQAKPRAGDATGRKAAQLREEHADELKAREAEIATTQAQAAEESTKITDLTEPSNPVEFEPEDGGEVIGHGPETPSNVPGATPYDQRMRDTVDVDNPPARAALAPTLTDVGPQDVSGDRPVVIRVNQDLDDVTIGAGNTYNFEEGRQYRVPSHVAAHLEEKGLLWH